MGNNPPKVKHTVRLSELIAAATKDILIPSGITAVVEEGETLPIVPGTFENRGTIRFIGGGDHRIIAGDFINSGAIEHDGENLLIEANNVRNACLLRTTGALDWTCLSRHNA